MFPSAHHAGTTPGPKDDVPRVSTVLGTMTIPNPLGKDATREALDYFLAAGYDEIDTALIYQEGKTEVTLGKGPLLWIELPRSTRGNPSTHPCLFDCIRQFVFLSWHFSLGKFHS